MSELAPIQSFLNGKVELHRGDCRERVRALPNDCIDSVVTDPPYALVSIGKRFGKDGAAPATPKEGAAGAYARASAGFMGQQWDTGETAFDVAFWRDIYRVLKPGGHVVAFSATRTYHRLAVAIEDAGFEIRDMGGWLYGSGFPKSHDVSKGIDRRNGDERPVIGREHLSNDIRGGALIDAAHDGLRPGFDRNITSAASAAWEGWGTALKPAIEPIVIARKPLIGTVAANVSTFGTGALNIDGCRVGWSSDADESEAKDKNRHADFGSAPRSNAIYGKDNRPPGVNGNYDADGRWPANILHDGSDEVVALLGQAARFFYSAKADGDDRIGSKHPTVKPVDLMRWFCRLVTPPGGTILDPFAGTGTTGEAAFREGFSAILCEREAAFQVDIGRRMQLALAGPSTRRAEAAKARNGAVDNGPLFGGEGAIGGGGGPSTDPSPGTHNRPDRPQAMSEA